MSTLIGVVLLKLARNGRSDRQSTCMQVENKKRKRLLNAYTVKKTPIGGEIVDQNAVPYRSFHAFICPLLNYILCIYNSKINFFLKIVQKYIIYGINLNK
jgi:hypothetical protein